MKHNARLNKNIQTFVRMSSEQLWLEHYETEFKIYVPTVGWKFIVIEDVTNLAIFNLLTRCNYIQGCIQRFPDWPPGARTANGTALCHYNLCVASQWVFVVVILLL